MESFVYLIQRENSQDIDSSSMMCNRWIKVSSTDDYISIVLPNIKRFWLLKLDLPAIYYKKMIENY
jgi:hypothetical protein